MFPPEFKERTHSWMADYPLLERALDEAPPVSVRVNTSKTQVKPSSDGVPWCATGYYLDGRPAFTFDPCLHAGAYYVQEASSMFIEQAVGQYITSPAVALDLCAAPGGKSTHLLSLLPEGSVVVANELIRNRCAILTENIAKWGAVNAIVTQNDPADIGRLTHLFDLVVADMPCSGEGMFRKDAASRDEWSVANVRLCAERQRRIAHDVWDALRPGGLFVYSTCTFNREENEDNIRHLVETLGAEVLPLTVDADWNIAVGEDLPSYRFFPHRTRGEGFFLAIVRKPDGRRQQPKSVAVNRKTTTKPPQEIRNLLRGDFEFVTINGDFYALPDCAADIFRTVAERLRTVSAGVPVGRLKGKDFVPSQGLALSAALRKDAFQRMEMTWDEAVRYLQREAPALANDTPQGLYLAEYQGLPIGFARNIGRRINNLYPQEWRIRSRDLPPSAPRILP
ncbi:MAG: RsmB/NOP family class I SAM-dependent RNA methyltransferase [Tannerella sp.]|jgi:16S rRNA C967 or C1407 C5-methylase (RsmB/RsmF family)/NOL1/NOP2/fmu family ribosome biogenesis protein|nr:RsmB/NOP family class I SAM-dependent RNA methyltransferase [Tannerella sp.]